MKIHFEMTAEYQARYDTEMLTITKRGERLAALLFAAYHEEGDGVETSPVTISQATTLLRDAAVRDEVIALLTHRTPPPAHPAIEKE